jgi:hypothetical protein
MPSKTYTFASPVATVVPATVGMMKATYGHAASLPDPTTVTTEASQANVNKIKTSEETPEYWQYIYSDVGDSPHKVFWIKPLPTQTNLTKTKFTMTVKGYSEDDKTAENYTLSLRVWNGSTWELLDSDATGNPTTLTGSLTADLSNYVNDGYLYFAVDSDGVGAGDEAHPAIYTDFVSFSEDFTYSTKRPKRQYSFVIPR